MTDTQTDKTIDHLLSTDCRAACYAKAPLLSVEARRSFVEADALGDDSLRRAFTAGRSSGKSWLTYYRFLRERQLASLKSEGFVIDSLTGSS